MTLQAQMMGSCGWTLESGESQWECEKELLSHEFKNKIKLLKNE